MLYTTFQTVEARVDISYVGTEVNGDSFFERPLKGAIRHGIIVAGYVIPFAMVVLIMLIIILMYEETWELLMWLLKKVRSITCRNYEPLNGDPNAPNGVPNAPNGVQNVPNGVLKSFGRRCYNQR